MWGTERLGLWTKPSVAHMAGGFAVSELPYSGLISKLCAAGTVLRNPSGLALIRIAGVSCVSLQMVFGFRTWPRHAGAFCF